MNDTLLANNNDGTDNYDKFAEAYRQFRTSSSDNDRGCYELLKALGEDRLKGRVLDIGCGQGHFTEILSALGPEVVGVDISESQIEIAKSNPAARCHYQKVLRAEFPFPSESFDAAISTFCLCTEPNFNDVNQTIVETSRILRPGGWFGAMHVNFADVLGQEFATFSVPWVKDLKHGSLVEISLCLPSGESIVVKDYFHDDEHYIAALKRCGFIEICITNASIDDGRKLYKLILAKKNDQARSR